MVCMPLCVTAQIQSAVEFQLIVTKFDRNPTFKIIKFDLDNLITCISIPTGQFEGLLVSNGFEPNSEKPDDYSSGTTMWGYQFVKKEPKQLRIFFIDNTGEGRTLFNNVLDQLEEYYLNRDGDFLIYGFTKDDKEYAFRINKEKLFLVMYVK